MAQITLDDAVRVASSLHQSGRLMDARRLYEGVLKRNPNHPDALNLLGVLFTQIGEHEQAEAMLRRAVERRAESAAYWNNLGALLRDRGRLEEAAEAFRRAGACGKGSADAFANLGHVYRALGQRTHAIESFASALKYELPKEKRCRLLNDQGLTLREAGQDQQAVASFRSVLTLEPNDPVALQRLSSTLARMGHTAEAMQVGEKASETTRASYEALAVRAMDLVQNGRIDDGVIALKRAMEIAPDQPGVYMQLCQSMQIQGRPDPAEQTIRHVLRAAPTFGPAHRLMADIHFIAGRIGESLEELDAAIKLDPQRSDNAHSARCFERMFMPGQTPAVQHADLRSWGDQYALPLLSRQQPHHNTPDPDRRLRIGYVSPNFTNHCQSFFMMPLLSSHDLQEVEVYCYSDVEKAHPTGDRLQSFVQHWRHVFGKPHAEVADQVRNDHIDIFVDLTMHMSQTRLLAMAEKPAPVQVTWLAYPGSTGVSAIDYRLTDPYLDPPDMFDSFYVEKSIRLPDTFWVYDPLADVPVNEPPHEMDGHITFGCFNNFAKINPGLLQLWARVLRAVPRSKMVLLTPAGRHRDWALNILREAGADDGQIEFVGRHARLDYLRLYNRVDITLDTVPYNGHTTSLDSYWMGVPVVSLLGDTVVGRASLSQMTNLNMLELLAYDEDQYVRIAADLANDADRMKQYRSTLRERMKTSPLTDGRKFARGMENAFREMWRTWCAQQSPKA